MAKSEPGATIPVLTIEGTHAEIGLRLGQALKHRITAVVSATQQELHDNGISDEKLRVGIAPYVDWAQRIFPEYMTELVSIAKAAETSFDILFHLNFSGFRPSAELNTPRPNAIDLKVVQDNCTSVASRGGDSVIVGHTEDAAPECLDDLYLADVKIIGDHRLHEGQNRLLGLNYGHTLFGCAASINSHGLIALVDSLEDPEPAIGVPRDFLTRALVDRTSIDEAIDLMESTPRSGAFSCILVQGKRVTNLEVTSRTVNVLEVADQDVFAHTNHYLNADLRESTRPRPDSLSRLLRAQKLLKPEMDVSAMKQLLSDQECWPNSICRERTIGAFIAESSSARVLACLGEPASATWIEYG